MPSTADTSTGHRLPPPQQAHQHPHPPGIVAVPHPLHLHQELGLDAACCFTLALAAGAAQRINLQSKAKPGHLKSGSTLPLQPQRNKHTAAAQQQQGIEAPQLTSSMKMMAGAFSRASANKLLTSFSDSPIHLETKSEEDTLKKVESASVATACTGRAEGAALRSAWAGLAQLPPPAQGEQRESRGCSGVFRLGWAGSVATACRGREEGAALCAQAGLAPAAGLVALLHSKIPSSVRPCPAGPLTFAR